MLRKGIKILGKVLSAIVLLLVMLPVLAALLLDIPAVQNMVVHKAAQQISRRLGTTVRIGRVDIGLFSRVRIEELYVEDFQHDTLLYAGRLDASFSALGLFGGGIVMSEGVLQNARFCLRETPEGEMNVKQLVDRLVRRKGDGSGKFRLTMERLRAEGLDFCLEKLEHRKPPYGIDFSNLRMHVEQAAFTDFVIDGPAIYAVIDRFSARERSGFVLDDLNGRFYLVNGCIGIEEARIRAGRSDVGLSRLSLVGESWADYKDFVHAVEIDGVVTHTRLSTDELAYFSPGLRSWHTELYGVELTAQGSVADLTVRLANADLGAETSLALDMTARGLPDIRHTRFDVRLARLTTTAADADELATRVTGKELPGKAVSILDNAGRIALSGRFRGTLSDFSLDAVLGTPIGEASADLKVRPLRNGMSGLEGNVSTRSLRLGELLGNRQLGRLTARGYVSGSVGKGSADANVSGSVSQLEFRGYDYDSIRYDGHLTDKEFSGRLTVGDPNLRLDFDGLIDLNGRTPRYDFRLDLERADLAALGFNRRDSVSVLAARLDARASGRSPDDLNGIIRIRDASYRYNDREVRSEGITVVGRNTPESKYLELTSDFADVTFRSRTSYREVIDYLRSSLRDYLPVLYDNPGASRAAPETVAATDDYSLLTVSVKHLTPITDAVADGLQVADSSQLRLLFNPVGDKLSLKVSSDYVERGRLLATMLRINVTNEGDSLTLYASTEDFYLGAVHMNEISVMGGARDNRVLLSAGFRDSTSRLSGLIGFRARPAPAQPGRGRAVDIRLTPSHITRGDKTWQIGARRIVVDSAAVEIDRFRMMNADQELLIDGIASRSRRDSVDIRLSNFDLAALTQIAGSMGYAIEGRTNGYAVVKSALHESEITAEITIDSMAVNRLKAPPLRFSSKWDFERNRAGFILQNRLDRDTLLWGFYAPSKGRYYARATIDSLDMGLLDPVLKGVIGNTSGKATVDVTLTGEGRQAALSGHIGVRDLRTTVDFTQVTYSMPRAELRVEDNHFIARRVPVFDPDGNRGLFDLDLNLEHLSNIAYAVRIDPERMMVLNTTKRNSDLFYGRIFASGAATITGSKAGVNMDIVATTDDNSQFFMPLSGSTNAKTADFVTFESAEKPDTVNYLVRKKLMFERRRKQKTSGGGSMDITMALNVRPNVDFQLVIDPMRGDVVRGRGEGLLNLRINPRRNIFEMYGDYTISEGSYQLSLENIISKKFIIESGSMIQWTGEPVDALLNIDAVYRLKASLQPLLGGGTTRSSGTGGDDQSPDGGAAYAGNDYSRPVPVECVIHIGGRLTNPQLTFSVRVPDADQETQAAVANALNTESSAQQQFAALLLFGSFISDGSVSSSSNLGVSATVGSGIEMLSNYLSNLISTDEYNIRIGYRPKSDIASDELDIGFSKNLIDNRLFIELEGNYVIDPKYSANNNVSNFMGEAYLTWMIDRSGNLRLKVFTQTIDRFDENQGLQETGIGIYYKEDFNNFKDLRQRIKARFTNKERRARREARRAARREAMERGDTETPASDVERETDDLPGESYQ